MRSSTSGAGEGIITRRRGGGVVETAVLCRLGAAREYQKMNANRKAQGRGGSIRVHLLVFAGCSQTTIPPAVTLGRGGGNFGNIQKFDALQCIHS